MIRTVRLLGLAQLLLGFLLATLALPGHATQPPEPVRQAARQLLARQTAGLPGKVSIEVGDFDPRNQLPACATLDATLPPGTRAWGLVNVAVRCVSPVEWTAYVPARVSVLADYLVARRPIRSGQVVAPDDLDRSSGDLAAQADNTLTDATQAVGHRARYSITAGSVLRMDMLVVPPTVKQGQNVKVIGAGEGFTVANEGRALNAAAPGEVVRVRMSNGQVVSGTARADGNVEIRF